MKQKDRHLNNYIVFDVETGGLDADKNPITEIAMVTLIDGKNGLEIDEKLSFDSLIRPYNEDFVYEEKALTMTGIKKKDIDNGNGAIDVMDAIIELSETLQEGGKRRKPILVGHNIDEFDMLFLNKFFELQSKSVYDYFNRTTIDTYTLARMFFRYDNNIDSLKLETVCNYFGVRLPRAHRACDDARANAELFIKIQKLFLLKRKELIRL